MQRWMKIILQALQWFFSLGSTFNCSTLTMETPKQYVKFTQS